MKKFTVSCKDNKTGLEMILSEAGFNQAMFFIENNFTVTDVHSVKEHGTNNYITVIETTTRTLLYDENREILVGD